MDEGTLDLEAAIHPGIEHMRCAAHTLQLAVFDGIKNSSAETVIGRIRNVVKEGRTPKISEIIKKRTKKFLLLDMDTRWGSTFMMLDRLIELKAAVQEIGNCGNRAMVMTDSQWKEAEQLRDLLQKAFEVTKKLQYADITPGYFYRKWSGLQLFYNDYGSLLAKEIAKSMKKGETDLLNSGLLLAAVLLDVYNLELLPLSSVEKGKETVSNLTLRMKGLETPAQILNDNDGWSTCSGEDTDSDKDMRKARKKKKIDSPERLPSNEDEELPEPGGTDTAFASPAAAAPRPSTPAAAPRPRTPAGSAEKRKSPDVKTQIITGVHAGIKKLLEQRTALKKTKKDLLTLIKEDYPAKLKDVALLLYAKPVTQVSVERLFSALKIFKSDRRSQLKEDILNACLLLKANQ